MQTNRGGSLLEFAANLGATEVSEREPENCVHPSDVGLVAAFRNPQGPSENEPRRGLSLPGGPQAAPALPALPCPAVQPGVYVPSFWEGGLAKFSRSLGPPVFSFPTTSPHLRFPKRNPWSWFPLFFWVVQ